MSSPEIDPTTRRAAEFLLRLVFDGYFTTHVSGLEWVPPEGVPTLVVANHASSLDVFAAGHAVRRQGYFLAKREATSHRLFGRLLRGLGAIPAQRDGRDMTAVKHMLAVLERGHLLGVAPEGTRSPTGELGAFDTGFVWLAARSGAQIVPCAIHGTWQRMPKGHRFPRSGPLWVRFGEPITVLDRRPSKEEVEAIAADVRARILSMLAALAAESGVPSPAIG
jgi:1-acyl-sn-glycerol-3-phosphate acyltransferase